LGVTSIVDNTSEVEIRFPLKNAAGAAIGPAASGHSVFASTNLGTLRQNPTGTTIPMRDNGDGTYSVWLSSPTVGDAAVGISVNDVNAGSIVVTFFASGNLPMALTSATPTYAEGTAFDVVATFARDVTGFAASDVVATGATVGAIGTGPNAYTITLTPTGTGPITVSVPAGVAEETTNTSGGATAYVNEASNVLTISLSNVALTQKAISGFMLSRANNLVSNQPGLTRFLLGNECNGFNASATEANGSINGCATHGNVWADFTGSWSSGSSYALGTIGAHRVINPDLLVGGMLQFDHAEEDTNTASGNGWMVGPYFVAKHGTQPLFFEGRLLYGGSSNTITAAGTTGIQSFSTNRSLAQLRATGEYELDNVVLMPMLDFTYTDDTQKTFVDTNGNTVPGQTVGVTQLSFGMDFKMPLSPSTDYKVDFTGGISGIYSETSGGEADFGGGRGRVHFGLNSIMSNGSTFEAGVFYDGIGSDYESYGANAGLAWKF
jgi:hypothetical protein